MAPLVGHILLAVSVASLAGAGYRAASAAGALGLERAIATAVLAAGAAVAWALLLGIASLGTSPAALTAAAVVTYAAARLMLPEPRVRLAGELRRFWSSLPPGRRALLGAAAGAGIAWTAWLLRYPALGHDMVLYHLSEAVTWVHGGSPGTIEPVADAIPVGTYPVTHEVLLSWLLGISRGFAAVTLSIAGLILLLALAAWSGLRALAVPRLATGLAVAALLLLPATIASQSGGGTLDPVALAWLAACGALCAGAWRGRTALLCPALVAAGLAGGTKTTALPLALVLLTITLVPLRRRLRPLAVPLAASAAAGLGVGGVWYLRNLFEHGSPLWPFVAAPWGDPRPAIFRAADVRFLQRPEATVSRLGDYYLHHFAAGIALLAGALLVAAASRRREVLAAAALTLVSLLLWMDAPFTGVLHVRAFDAGTGDATRYLLPGLAAAALTLALAVRSRARGGGLALVALTAAAALGARDTFALGFPSAPGLRTPLAGAAVGAAAFAAAGRLNLPRLRAGWVLGLAAVVAAGALAALASHGYVARHGRTGLFDAGVVRWFESQPDASGGRGGVAISSSLLAPLAGDRLRHSLRLLHATGSCRPELAPGTRWIVIDRVATGTSVARAGLTPAQRLLLACLTARRPAYADRSYAVYRVAPP